MTDEARLGQALRKMRPGSKGGEFKGAQWMRHRRPLSANPVPNDDSPPTPAELVLENGVYTLNRDE